MSKVGSILMVLAMLIIPAAVLATHNTTVHQLAWWDDAVELGNLNYTDWTAYDTAKTHADNTWSALGKVNVQPYYRNVNGGLTLEWRDYTNTTDGLCGYERNSPPPSRINLNTHFMNPASDAQEKACAAHELGHGLGIGDHGTGYTAALMYGHIGTITTPQSHDISDYNTRWP